MKAPTSWRGFLLAGAGLLDGGRQWVSEGDGGGVAGAAAGEGEGEGSGGVRFKRGSARSHELVGEHAQRNISDSERK